MKKWVSEVYYDFLMASRRISAVTAVLADVFCFYSLFLKFNLFHFVFGAAIMTYMAYYVFDSFEKEQEFINETAQFSMSNVTIENIVPKYIYYTDYPNYYIGDVYTSDGLYKNIIINVILDQEMLRTKFYMFDDIKMFAPLTKDKIYNLKTEVGELSIPGNFTNKRVLAISTSNVDEINLKLINRA